jgi:hypothetical protein
MSELLFERGLFATLAAALIVPELTTFLIFLFVALTLSGLFVRQAWSLLAPSAMRPATLDTGRLTSERPTLRLVSELTMPTAE